MGLADIYRIFHPKYTQYTFVWEAHGNFSKTYHMWGQKASLSKYKKIKIIPCILSDHNALKWKLNNKNNSRFQSIVMKMMIVSVKLFINIHLVRYNPTLLFDQNGLPHS
jgi:uncharacterized membrane protein YbaN (DUF454 family)